MKIGKKCLEQELRKIYDLPRVDSSGDLIEQGIDSFDDQYLIGEIIWDEANDSIWNVPLKNEPTYLLFMCSLIEILWNFLISFESSNPVNKYFYGYASFSFAMRDPSMILVNKMSNIELDRFIGIFSDDYKFNCPKNTRNEDGSYTNCMDEICSTISETLKLFEKSYERSLNKDFSVEKKSLYKYKPEELVKKIILCFEANKDDVPFDSKIYHSDSFQKILAKANALREYAEDKGVLEPLSEDEKRSKYKLIPVEEAKL